MSEKPKPSRNGLFVKGGPGGPGRPRGRKDDATIAREKAQAEADAKKLEDIESTEMPKDFMLRAMRSTKLTYEQRMAAAKAAAPFCHPYLQAIAHKHMDVDGNPIAP